MKITFDGITIEDAKLKEMIDFVKAVRGGRKITSTQAGVYKLPKAVTGEAAGKQEDGQISAWTDEELIFLMDNLDTAPRKLKANPILANRGLTAISGRKSSFRSGKKERMSANMWKLYQSKFGENATN